MNSAEDKFIIKSDTQGNPFSTTNENQQIKQAGLQLQELEQQNSSLKGNLNQPILSDERH